MTEEAEQLYDEAQAIKSLYLAGRITRAEAVKGLTQYANYYNKTAERIAKKYGRKPVKFSFSAFMR